MINHQKRQPPTSSCPKPVTGRDLSEGAEKQRKAEREGSGEGQTSHQLGELRRSRRRCGPLSRAAEGGARAPPPSGARRARAAVRAARTLEMRPQRDPRGARKRRRRRASKERARE
ncbi:unnamed protein product [Prorocentrum cordatum]|uniref:Uncharacterized protein n=1 Tax=Prorocentrum cordatum TaxID=2364126 RepID=A0ABN9U907_9DINO|nr:unnamed protein product [Polarella glacialis]